VSSLEAASCNDRQLILALIFGFLVADVVANDLLVSAYCRYEISTGPKALPSEVFHRHLQ
jgi:hypothetical protein